MIWQPRIRTVASYDSAYPTKVVPERLAPWHLCLGVTWRIPEAERLYCGDSWCTGGCGLPALVIGTEMKAYSNMTAMGPVMQSWRTKWEGPTEEVPKEHQSHFLQRYWM